MLENTEGHQSNTKPPEASASKKRQHILISDVEGKPAVCFDTGLEPRSFARTKMSQSLVEKGYIVRPDGSKETWMSSGVCEFSNHMRVWGTHFPGIRFDQILGVTQANTASKDSTAGQTALHAIIYWIKAKLYLGDTYSTLNPAATFISSDGSVFFSPPNLSNRCLHIEGMDVDRFNCPDLSGMEAVAFCAGAMLYKVLTNTFTYPVNSEIYQDMREGVFLPLHYAAFGLNKELCSLIESALNLPVDKKKDTNKNASDILHGMLSLLTEKGKPVLLSSLFNQLPTEQVHQLEREKKGFVFKQNSIVKTRRFAVRNKYLLIGTTAVVLFVLFIVFSMLGRNGRLPTTEGMLPVSVVYTYYDKFSALDHVWMEACINGADKADINAAAGFYAVMKTRQAYEGASVSHLVPARTWQENGGELPAPNVFGVTDLSLERLTSRDDSDMVIFRVNYLLWAPDEHSRGRTDVLTLQRDRRKNWRITEIIRTER